MDRSILTHNQIRCHKRLGRAVLDRHQDYVGDIEEKFLSPITPYDINRKHVPINWN